MSAPKIIRHILLTLLILGVLIFALALWLLSPLFSGRLDNTLSERITTAGPHPLPAGHPALGIIQAEIQRHSRPTRDTRGGMNPWTVKAEPSGPDTEDWINSNFDIHLSRNRKTLSFLIGFSDLVAIGLDDVDGDGTYDAWACDPGDKVCSIHWGTPQGKFAGGQGFELPSYRIDGGAFFDVDGDGHLDFVYHESEIRQYFWIKMAAVK